MSTVHPSTPAHAASATHPWARLTAIVFLVILGLGALAGGLMLVTTPDGSSMGFELSLLSSSPFPDYLVPGLVLGGLFGVGSLVVALMSIRNQPSAPYLAFAIGCAQMIWIVVELAMIGTFSVLHPAMFLVGAVIAVSSAVWGWPSFVAWRSSRA